MFLLSAVTVGLWEVTGSDVAAALLRCEFLSAAHPNLEIWCFATNENKLQKDS
jgi:hypothetical protein